MADATTAANPGKPDKEDKQDKQDITVTVFAPREPDPKTFTWDKHRTVGDTATEAATAFKYAAGTPTFVKDGKVLERTKQLVAAGVRDGDQLELTDIGGGV
ncbi:MAG TPA: hypothetical protein VMO26_03405 [Vicinamibacterales bacterium]|nr:hypothetical protein [Vicinamibacterales bacterium]